jgi:ribosome-associated protein YbcJ (S4-like RNA binding protein)
VGETDEFIKSGGVIKFVIEDYKIRLLIDRKAAERQGLRVSSKLLQIAHIVD